MGKGGSKVNPQEQVEADVSPARLGKEVKIGLAVIAGLFTILAVVVGVRIFGGGAEVADADSPAEAAPMPENALALATKPNRPPADARRTTFLPAKPPAEKPPSVWNWLPGLLPKFFRSIRWPSIGAWILAPPSPRPKNAGACRIT